MTASTETFEAVRDRIVAKVGGQPTEWIEELDWRAYAAVLRVHTLEHLAQVRAIIAAD